MLAPGQAVDRYEVIEFLGRGGTSDVYRVRSALSDEEGSFALKLLREDLRGSPVLQARLCNEALMLDGMHLPGVVRVLSQGRWADRPFIVLEYLPGGSLAGQRIPVAIPRALSLGIALARTLAELHSRGIVHRDVKPHNVLLTAEDEPKLTDFGHAKNDLAKAEGRIIPHSTETGTFLGTRGYAAPEQVRNSKTVSGSADVYALGVLLFEQLTGHHPYSDADLELAVNLTRDAPSLSFSLPAAPPLLTDLIARMLARRPHMRPDATEVAVRLAVILQSPLRPPPGSLFRAVAGLAIVGLMLLPPPVPGTPGRDLELAYKNFEQLLDDGTIDEARRALELAANLTNTAGLASAWAKAKYLYKRADLARVQGHLQEAAQLYEESLLVWRQRALAPGTPDDHRHLAICANELGDVLLHLHQPDRALALYREAWHHQDILLSNEFSSRPQLAYTQYRIALAHLERREPAEAQKALHSAWDLLSGRRDHPDIPLYRSRVAERLAELVSGPQAAEYAQQAYAIGRDAWQEHPHSKRHQLAYWRAVERLAEQRRDSARLAEALAERRRLWLSDPAHGMWTHELLASLLCRLRRNPLLQDEAREAHEVLRSMAERGQWIGDQHVQGWQQELNALDLRTSGVIER